MSQDTNREDRVERTPVIEEFAPFTLADWERLVHRQIGAAFAVTPRMQGARICVSCGAATDPYGNLPCGH
ncbi:hypothetical protein [Paraburkholderia xenovorans]|uniref:hypothetical protein n=1 Tax=Paraburkholderia xenovorans TaxID=36873 RepID=UPI0038B94565